MEKAHTKSAEVLPQASGKHKKSFSPQFVAVALVLTAVIFGAGGALAGYQKGKAKGGQEAIKKIGDAINPLNLLANNPVMPNTVMGQVTDVGNNEITLKLVNGDQKKVRLSERLQVTKKNETISAGDLQNGNQVTVFVNKEGNRELATRIIVR